MNGPMLITSAIAAFGFSSSQFVLCTKLNNMLSLIYCFPGACRERAETINILVKMVDSISGFNVRASTFIIIQIDFSEQN